MSMSVCVYLALRLDSDHMTSLHHDLIHWFVQHVGSSVDGTQPVDDITDDITELLS